MKIYLASDHGGYKLKDSLKKYLIDKKYTVIDIGPDKYNALDDYPDFVIPAARQIAKAKQRGVFICRNGIGVCIVANKIKGIRAVSTNNLKIAKTSRLDDDTNVLCLGQDYLTLNQAKKIVDMWLGTEFSKAARHVRRLNKIRKIENC